jgi:hypothetical protein
MPTLPEELPVKAPREPEPPPRPRDIFCAAVRLSGATNLARAAALSRAAEADLEVEGLLAALRALALALALALLTMSFALLRIVGFAVEVFGSGGAIRDLVRTLLFFSAILISFIRIVLAIALQRHRLS